MMTFENSTLGELLSDPRIRPIARDAIRNRNLKEEELWNMTLMRIKTEHFFSGEIGKGIQRLYEAADTGDWYYPLYSEAECAADPARKGVSLVWFPSADPDADDRPFLFIVPGGGYENVWNLTEGWPIAEQFNRRGYHSFILTYQVDGEEKLLEKNMEDFARALRLIREKEAHFHLNADRYITCGFSAGGYLICLWNTDMGYPAHALPKPQASFPVYPATSWKLDSEGEEEDPEWDKRMFGCSIREAVQKEFEIPEHAEGFPPCAIFLAAGDELVDPEHSRMLERALTALHIPCRMEIGPTGGHGFADGSGMCMAGWTGRAVTWFEGLR